MGVLGSKTITNSLFLKITNKISIRATREMWGAIKYCEAMADFLIFEEHHDYSNFS